jgi:cytochrome b561
MKQYHPILVVIHWVMLVLIVMAWTSGQFVLEHTPNSDPGKIDALRMHMTVGLIAGALLVLRLITKLRSEQPPHAKTGSALLDKAGVWAHWAFYVVIPVDRGQRHRNGPIHRSDRDCVPRLWRATARVLR